jgi:hypothetical protein
LGSAALLASVYEDNQPSEIICFQSPLFVSQEHDENDNSDKDTIVYCDNENAVVCLNLAAFIPIDKFTFHIF